MPQRLLLDRDARILTEDETGIEVQGALRLSPGHDVDVITHDPAAGRSVRRALVLTWRIATLSSRGPIYRGYCRWM